MEGYHASDLAKLLTPKDVMGLLKISQPTLYRMVDRRLIPFYKIGRGLRFGKRDVEMYLEKMRVKSSSEWK